MRIGTDELRDSARDLLDGVGAGAQDAVWKAVVEAGWPALTVAEAQGGLEQSLAEAAVLYAELGRALAGAPLLPSLMAAEALAACPPSSGRDEWLERIAGGEALAASLCDPSLAEARMEEDGALTGRLLAVQGAEGANAILLLSADPPVVALLPLAADGVEVVGRRTWDETRRISEVRLTRVRLDEAAVLARGEAARPALAAAAAHLGFALAADCAGAADRLLKETVAYLKTRRQFDRPLALFQALKHRCADLKARVAAAQALIAQAVEAQGPSPALQAKALASTVFREVAEEAVQLHGGIGMTSEHPCHRYLKRALLNEQLGLPNDVCELAVGRELATSLKEVAA